MPKPKTFWTPKRLIELRKLSRTMTEQELAGYFEKHVENIRQAIIFEQNKRRLKLSSQREIINGRSIEITIYAAAHSDGSHQIINCRPRG